jgi:hypothetical protein
MIMKMFDFAFNLFPAVITPTFIYIGPGAGAGAIVILIAIIAGLLLLFMGFLWYPLKRLIAKKKKKKK